MGDELVLRAGQARPFLAVGSAAQLTYVAVELRPAERAAAVRVPLQVCFVLDRSGSMSGEKIVQLQQAVLQALDLLQPGDQAAIVTFAHQPKLALALTAAADRRRIAEAVGGIKAGGGTRMAPAMELGLAQLRQPFSGRKVLLLLTDGQTEHEKECLYWAAEAGRLGIPFTAFGIGSDWNEQLLETIAAQSGGSADYISDAGALQAAFTASVQQAQQTVIEQSHARLRLVNGVVVRAVWHTVPLISQQAVQAAGERDVGFAIGEIAGSGRALLLELLVDGRPAGEYRIGELLVDYDIPALQIRGGRTSLDLVVRFSDDAGQVQQVTPAVMNTVEKVSAFKLQTRALRDIESGDVDAAAQKLKGAVTRLLNQGEVELAATVQREISHLEQSGQLSAAGQKTIRFQGRKTVRLSEDDLPKE
jgi:Ca-activated chloride channel homolog